MRKENQLIEIWGDVVEMKSLLLSIIISSLTTMGSYYLAPNGNKTKQLLLGLGGTVIGFIICSIIFKPKRSIEIEIENNEEIDA